MVSHFKINDENNRDNTGHIQVLKLMDKKNIQMGIIYMYIKTEIYEPQDCI